MTTQDPIDRDPTQTDESEGLAKGHDRATTETPSETPPPLDASRPPADLPLAPQGAEVLPGTEPSSATESATLWFDPRPFLARHVVGIARGVSVAIVVVILLISWQGVATGQSDGAEESGSSTEKNPDPSDKKMKRGPRVADAAETHFDMGKLEKYAARLEREKKRSTSEKQVDDATTPATGTVRRVPPPAEGGIEPATPDSTADTAAKTDEKSRPSLIIPPVQGPTDHPSPSGSDLRPDPAPLSQVGSADLEWSDGFELALALQAEFAELQPVEISALKSVLYQHLLELSRLTGRSDNPLERLTALAELIENRLRLQVTQVSSTDTLLPASVLAEHRASPLGWCVVALALADRTRDLSLEPVLSAGEIALRYRNGAHRYVLSPLAPDRVLTEREFAVLASGDSTGPALRALSRPEFWGHVLSEGGIDRVEQGAWARGMALIEQGLDLDPRQPRARVAQAAGFLERQEEARALECLDAAVLLDGTDRTARRARVELLLDLGRTDAAAEDLDFLARDGSDPLDTVRYARWWLERREYRRAHMTLEKVLAKSQNDEVGSAAQKLRIEIAAAPWIEVLEESHDDRERLRAARRLGRFPLPRAREALIHALSDENGHLANVALAVLRQSTGLVDLPRDPDLWRRAMAKEYSGE